MIVSVVFLLILALLGQWLLTRFLSVSRRKRSVRLSDANLYLIAAPSFLLPPVLGSFAFVLVANFIVLLFLAHEIVFRLYHRPFVFRDLRLIGLGFGFINLRWVAYFLSRLLIIFLSSFVFALIFPLFYVPVIDNITSSILGLFFFTLFWLRLFELRDRPSMGLFRHHGYLIYSLCQVVAPPFVVESDDLSLEEDRAEHLKPHVVVVVLESFFDLSAAPHIKLPDFLPHYRRLSALYPSGSLMVPVVGGMTSNTEFEVLTGQSVDRLPPGLVPFRDLTLKTMPSLPRALARSGYETSAFHPGQREFWNRHVAYADLGFKTFESLEDLGASLSYLGSFAENASLFEVMFAKLTKAKKPQFLYGVTIFGHSPYDRVDPAFSYTLPESCSDELRHYAALLTHMDASLEKLERLVSSQAHPTVCLILGDHAPLLASSPTLQELGFVDGKHVPSQDASPSFYSVPYLLLNNMGKKLDLGLSTATDIRQAVTALVSLVDDEDANVSLDAMMEPLVRAEALMAEQRFDDAVDVLQNLPHYEPVEMRRCYLLGVTEGLRGQRKAALVLLNAVVNDPHQAEWAHYWMARFQMEEGDWYYAESHLHYCQTVWSNGLAEMARFDDVRARETARLLLDVESRLEAISHLRDGVRLSLARKAIEDKDFDLAAGFLSSVQHQTGDLWFNKGFFHARKGEHHLAAEAYTKALDLGSDLYWSLYQRANAYLQMGKAQEASRDLDVLLERFPDDEGVKRLVNSLGH